MRGEEDEKDEDEWGHDTVTDLSSHVAILTRSIARI